MPTRSCASGGRRVGGCDFRRPTRTRPTSIRPASGAIAAFERCKALVIADAPDRLGLGNASIGREAGLALDRAGRRTPLSWTPRAGADPSDIVDAVTLYATEAAGHGETATDSLVIVAEGLLGGPASVLDSVVDDAAVRRLLEAYALASLGDASLPFLADDTENGNSFARKPPADLTRRVLATITAAVARSRRNAWDDGELAALAYRIDPTSDETRRLARASYGPIGAWVRAKLAVMDATDPDDAAPAYAALVREVEVWPADLEPRWRDRVRGEASVLELSRGEFVEALQILYPVAKRYWGDVAYLAERVLTLDELRRFVDAHADHPVLKSPPFWRESFSPSGSLRALLARRLVRAGLFDEAAAYFDDPGLRADAWRLQKDLRRARSAFWEVGRARALWRAAVLLRERGDALTASEAEPDQASAEESFDFLVGPASYPLVDRQSRGAATITGDERWRDAQSSISPDLRFHHRYLATDLALRAAELVPARSQAYAAMLCRASYWMKQSGVDGRAHAIWRTYVQRGAPVALARRFGTRDCSQPDFTEAARLRWTLPLGLLISEVAAHRALFAIAAMTLVGLTMRVWGHRARHALPGRPPQAPSGGAPSA